MNRADLKQWAADTRAHEAAYIVLDRDLPAGAVTDGTDSQGRRYLRCAPGLLDGVRRAVVDPLASPMPMWGTPVYRREDLPGGWPDAA